MPQPTRAEYLELSDRASLTPAELQAGHPALFALVAGEAARPLRERLLRRLGDAVPAARQPLAAADLTAPVVDGTGVAQAVRAALRDAGLAAAEVDAAAARLGGAEDDGPALPPLLRERPLREDPRFRDLLERADLHRLAEGMGLSAAAADAVVARAGDAAGLDDARVAALVDDGTLTGDEARRLGRRLGLYRMVGRDPSLAAALDDRGLDPRALAGRDRTGWAALLSDAGAKGDPDGLARRFAALHPTDALLGRLAARTGAAAERGARVARVRAANPWIELPSLDLSPGSADLARLDLSSLPPEEHREALAALKALRRALALAGGDVDRARALLEAGLDTAHAIVRAGRGAVAHATGMSAAEAAAVEDEAAAALAGATAALGTVLDGSGGDFQSLAVSNVAPELQDFLRRLDGWEDLFGTQASCRCESCQSILGPAAYFVDLMRFVETHVLAPHFSGEREGHPLSLKSRRPDLWTLELSCENVDTRIPTLDVVNEVLENYTARRLGYTGDLRDRAAVEDAVYTQALAASVDSFSQPFALALERLRAYLGHFGHHRAEVVRLVGGPPEDVAAARLGVGPAEWGIVTVPDPDPAFLERVYGFAAAPGADAFVPPLDARLLSRATGLDRDTLGRAVATAFVAAGSPGTPRLEAGKLSDDSVQNDVERALEFTPDALDRLHRFVRLLRRLPWSPAELDLALERAGSPGTALDAAAAVRLAELRGVQQALDLTLEEACGMTGDLTTRPLEPGGESLFGHLFNDPALSSAGSAQTLPAGGTAWVHPALRDPGSPAADDVLPRLLSGLRLDAEGLYRLVVRLSGPLGMDPAAPLEADRAFALSAANLTLLWRHARLAARLRLGVDELFQLLAAALERPVVEDAAAVEAVLAFHDWRRGSGWSLDDLGVVSGGEVRRPSAYPDPAGVAAALADEVRAAGALTFADTVFAFAGLTEAASRAVVDANPDRFERVPGGGLRLVPGAPADAPLQVPPGVSAAGEALAGVVRPFHPAALLPPRLGARLGLDAGRVAALAALAGADLDDPGLALSLREGGDPAPLAALAEALVPLSVLFRDDVFDPEALAWVGDHRALFGITGFDRVGVEAIRGLSAYVRHARPPREARFTEGAVAPDPHDVRHVLEAFTPTGGLSGAEPARLAGVVGLEPALVPALLADVALPGTATGALETAARAAALVRALGVDPATLGRIASRDYGEQARAAAGLRAATRARFPTEGAWSEAMRPLEDGLRAARREALADYLVHSVHPEFEDRRDLYHHFLMDVELAPGATTSRVVAATSAVQLYVHRILLNLERDRRGPSDPLHVHVPPDAIPAGEWAWRKHYRTWEANRKVFLYPENYLDPSLRDDRTPLFEALESELLQNELDEQHVVDAYATYLAGFEELGRLRIGGAYHDVDHAAGTDVLHLFGVSPGDPPSWHYRTAENVYHGTLAGATRGVTWTPWRRMDAGITARTVAPVVHRNRLHVFWTGWSTRPVSQVAGGGSTFKGYQHLMTLRFVTLRPDGTWTAPQDVSLDARSGVFTYGAGLVPDLLLSTGKPRFDPVRVHGEPLDGYGLSGPNWEEVYLHPADPAFPDALALVGRNHMVYGTVDLFRRRLEQVRYPLLTYRAAPPVLFSARNDGSERRLYYGTPYYMVSHENAWSNLQLEQERLSLYDQERYYYSTGMYQAWVALIGPDRQLLAVSGSPEDVVLQTADDAILLQGSVRDGIDMRMRRIGTRLAPVFAEKLFLDGIDGLLDREYQRSLQNGPLPLSVYSPFSGKLVGSTSGVDFTGPYGTYYREVFLHVPMLVARHLSAQGRHAAAQRWYHYLFNPTNHDPLPSAAWLTDEQMEQLLRERLWRYREFTFLDPPRLREILTDAAALEQYRTHPFNPHAIARLRMSAYQKAVVMGYVDNLLDWGDALFARFTTESIHEAALLYALASDVLGERPAELGACGTAAGMPRTYETIRPYLDGGSELLVEMETAVLSAAAPVGATETLETAQVVGSADPRAYRYVVDAALADAVVRRAGRARGEARAEAAAPAAAEAVAQDSAAGSSGTLAAASGSGGTLTAGAVQVGAVVSDPAAPVKVAVGRIVAPPPEPPRAGAFRGAAWKDTRTRGWKRVRVRDGGGGDAAALADQAAAGETGVAGLAAFGESLAAQVCPVFCVPPNRELHAYWDRVEDRLYKIRHGLDLAGRARVPALFAPEIDPRLLVRMKAAGLTLEDVLGAARGELPPYRFAFLIDRARQAAASVQGLGGALLSALEKKDAEELARLRAVHQQHLLGLTTRVREWEIDTARQAVRALERQQAAVEYRRGYYEGLARQGRSAWEATQSAARHAVSGIHGAEATAYLLGSVAHLLPQVGSPFAMKFGGKELGDSGVDLAAALAAGAALAEAVGAAAGLEGGFGRRKEGWEHQVELAEHELKQVETQLEAARIREEIAVRSLEIHRRSVEQAEEVFDFFGDRMTGLGLYTWLAATLQRLHREAYESAYAMARLAEQAFRFERGEEGPPLLSGGYWEPGRAGLLAGERLLIDLQAMERRFLETHYRSLEVDQAFSLTQVDPAALLALRETGTCEFEVPELFFDLAYPGQYRRRIRSVRLTIPCVTGPYVNVGASLALLESRIRPAPAPGPAGLRDVPPQRSVSVATSTAQNDGGVFEMSFRDERYMPFEGAGAVSRWRLSLPSSFRPFDYATINDVVLHLAYTAEEDAALRAVVEQGNDTLDGALAQALSAAPLVRVFSLRQDFSSAFHRLLHSPAGTPVPVETTPRHFPFFLAGRPLALDGARLALRAAAGLSPDGLSLALDGQTVAAFAPDATLGGLFAANVTPAFGGAVTGEHTLAVESPGPFGPVQPQPGDASALDPDRLADVLLVVSYRLAPAP